MEKTKSSVKKTKTNPKNKETNQELIVAKGIHKSFGKNKVLKGVDFKLNKGEKLAILGVNGAGKSTLINVILNIYKADKGEISYPFYKDDVVELQNNLGIQFQEGFYPPNFRVESIINILYDFKQNTKFNFREFFNRELYRKNHNDPMIDELLDIFDLTKVRKQKYKNLSGGQKQRLKLLAVLRGEPKIVILDEISTGLDILAQTKLLNYIKKYTDQKDITLLIISHLVHEMEKLVDKFVIIKDGVIDLEIDKEKAIKRFKSIERFVSDYFLKGEKTDV